MNASFNYLKRLHIIRNPKEMLLCFLPIHSNCTLLQTPRSLFANFALNCTLIADWLNTLGKDLSGCITRICILVQGRRILTSCHTLHQQSINAFREKQCTCQGTTDHMRKINFISMLLLFYARSVHRCEENNNMQEINVTDPPLSVAPA